MGKYEALVREILGAKNSSGASSRRFAMLNLQEETHFQSVMELFGGEEYVRTALPGLYHRALCAKNNLLHDQDSDHGFVDYAMIYDLSIAENTTAYSFGASSLKDIAQEIYSVMSIYQGDTRIGRNVSFRYNCHRAELDCQTHDSVVPEQGLRCVLQVTWTPQGSNMLHSMMLEAEALETVSDPVETAVFEHPVKTNFQKLTPVLLNVPNPTAIEVLPCKQGTELLSYVNVCYDRNPSEGEGVNYAYGHTRISLRQQRIFLDIRGYFTLKGNCIFSKLNHVSVGLELGSGGTALYGSYIDPKVNFQISNDGQKVSFAFPTDWSVCIPSKRLAGRELSYVDVMIEFSYMDGRSDDSSKQTERRAIVSASSMVYTSNQSNHFVQLDPVKLNWGCVEEHTLVRMADGTEQQVCDIQIGDKVYSSIGSATTVVQIYSGHEPELYVLRAVDGRTLKVTADHPICVGSGGYKTAANMTPVDQLVLEDGTLAAIDALYTIQGDFRVYSLQLAEESPLCCDGYLTGDYDIQGKVMCPDLHAEAPSAELLAEAEVLRKLFQ